MLTEIKKLVRMKWLFVSRGEEWNISGRKRKRRIIEQEGLNGISNGWVAQEREYEDC